MPRRRMGFVSSSAVSRWTGSTANLQRPSRCAVRPLRVGRRAICPHHMLAYGSPDHSNGDLLGGGDFGLWSGEGLGDAVEIMFEAENPGPDSELAVGGGSARAVRADTEDEVGARDDGELVAEENIDADADDEEYAEEDDEDEDDDADKDDDEDEEDEDLASYEIETDDEDEIEAVSGRRSFDEDGLPIMAARGSGSRGVKGDLGIGGVDADEDDDVVEFEESPEEVMDVSEDAVAGVDDDEVDELLGLEAAEDEDEEADQELLNVQAADEGNEQSEDDEEDVFDDESEAELRSAAETLKGTSLLGLGVTGAARSDSSDLSAFALGGEEEDRGDAGDVVAADAGTTSASGKAGDKKDRLPQPSPALGDFSDLVKRAEDTTLTKEAAELEVDDGDEDDFADPAIEEDTLDGPKNLDGYTDDDEHDDELLDFGVTTSTNFGRIWELNDDAYVTISEPGEAYAYDIDEDDSDDQDSAVLRRGAAGGWGGSLQSDARSALPVGSKEWIARRAYDLVTKASPTEMFKWTRARKSPPNDISALFPPEPPAPVQFPVTILDTAVPSPDGDDSSSWLDDENAGSVSGQTATAEVDYEPMRGHDALERSVDFPCMYKFKVVGSGPDFVAALTRDMEAVLGRKVPSNAFDFEPAGRYQRVVISVEVESAQQVTELYEAVGCADGVKFSYGY